MTTTPTTSTPVGPIPHPDSYRIGYLLSAITGLPDTPAKAQLLAAVDACEADIIKAAHTHGVDLDTRSREALARILENSEGLR